MPLLPSSYNPPRGLRNGHLQTVLSAVVRSRRKVGFERARLELDDGDFLDLDWVPAGTRRLAVLTHGLEGCSRNGYIRGMAAALSANGWDVLAWNFRGCGGEANRLLRFYHSGESRDLAAVISHAAEHYDLLVLVGFSLGGNVTLKYLGEAAPHPAVAGAATISVPVDLAACAEALDGDPCNRLYLRRFLSTLVEKVEAKAVHFPEHLNAAGARNIRSIAAFDERYTAPLHGFRSASDYWSRSSSGQFLGSITVPTLLLNARDDPFLAPSCFPHAAAEASASLFLEAPRFGGHVGFLDWQCGLRRWSEQRVVEFLGRCVEGG